MKLSDKNYDAVPEQKKQLYERLLKTASTGQGINIKKRESKEPAPLSFAQQRLWFINRLEPDSPVYNVHSIFLIDGELRVEILEKALNEIIRRHEILRTAFVAVDGDPCQLIESSIKITIPLTDLQSIPCNEREQRADSLLQQEICRSFDLAKPPLFRTKLLRLNREEYILAFTFHHIISDEWSMRVFCKELSELYAAYSSGRLPVLPDIPVQYSDYAVWQRENITGELLQKRLDYWKKHLQDAPFRLELPVDGIRLPVQTYRGERLRFMLEPELTSALNELSSRLGATMFMTLIAVFKTLLYIYTRQEDIVAGFPVAGRIRPETENQIGFFVNTLVLRTDLSGNPVFAELIKRVRENALDSFSNQDLPFDRLVEELHPERSDGNTPLFNVMFTFTKAGTKYLNLEGLKIKRIHKDTGTAKFDLTLYMIQNDEGLGGVIEFRTDLFRKETIEGMIGHLKNLVRSVANNPGKRLSELEIIDEAEKQKLLEEWNFTATDYPGETPVHELFIKQAKTRPSAIALYYGKKRVDYLTLNTCSNQFARFLRRKGIKRNDLVGLCMRSSESMIVAMLGILKAGGAYVPMDPAYPPERLRFMAEDAGLSMIIIDAQLKDIFEEGKADLICPDESMEEISKEREDKTDNVNTGADTVYVMYTSGSTGRPKGVVIPHRAINRLVKNTDYINIKPSDRIAKISNTSFDAATFEIWGALLNGAGLVLTDREKSLLPKDIEKQIKDNGISIMFLTTALFNLISEINPSAFRSLDTLLFGGETASPEAVRKILRYGPPGRLLHVYGPTENTVFSTWHEVKAVPENAVTVPIGRPVSNTTGYVLDSHCNLLPAGVPGELYLGGDGIAKGYLNMPDQSGKRFIKNPFSNNPDDILFRTGDLVRLMYDGNLEFVCRLDKQIKVRGFRVEPAEIEEALKKHGNVREAVVTTEKDASGNNQLTAYIVAGHDGVPDSVDMRSFLQGILPDFMIPSSYVPTDYIPLTPNGKTDFRLLIGKSRMNVNSSSDISGANDTEKKLKAVWEEVLGVGHAGIDDNFFSLGGHSLMALKLFIRIEKEFGIKLSPSVIFRESTIRTLAAFITKSQPVESLLRVVPLRSQGKGVPVFFVSPVMDNSSLIYYPLSKYMDNSYPLYGVESSETLLSMSMEEAASHSVKEIRRKLPDGPFMLIGFSSGGFLAFEIARQISALKLKTPFLGIIDTGCLNVSKVGLRQMSPGALGEAIKNLPFWLFYYLPFWIGHYHENIINKIAKIVPGNNGGRTDLSEGIIFDYGKVFKWLQKYRPQEYSGDITLFRAKAQGLLPSYPDKGWKHYARRVNIIPVPGNHLSIMKEPHVRVLAEKINMELGKLAGGYGN